MLSTLIKQRYHDNSSDNKLKTNRTAQTNIGVKGQKRQERGEKGNLLDKLKKQ